MHTAGNIFANLHVKQAVNAAPIVGRVSQGLGSLFSQFSTGMKANRFLEKGVSGISHASSQLTGAATDVAAQARQAALVAAKGKTGLEAKGLAEAARGRVLAAADQANPVRMAGRTNDIIRNGTWATRLGAGIDKHRIPLGVAAGAGALNEAHTQLVAKPRSELNGAWQGGQAVIDQTANEMANAGFMQRIGMLLNPQGAGDMYKQQAYEQLRRALGNR